MKIIHRPKRVFVIILLLWTATTLAQKPVAVIRDKYLIAESITYNEQTHEFFLSSINRCKIVAISEGGESRDFIGAGQDGYQQGLGLHIDPNNKVLWAVSNRSIVNSHTSGVWLYDLTNGQLLKKWNLHDTAAMLLNDLVITAKGDVYITDSEGSKVYHLEKSMDKPKPILILPKGDYPNGITLSKDDRYLFIATDKQGIICYDRKKHKHWEIAASAGTHANGMDGLFFYNNTLIGVDNSSEKPADHKITQFYLSADRKTIPKSRVIDEHNPYFDIPTSAVIREDSLFVLANSQLGNMDFAENKIRDTAILKKTYILGYKL